MKVLRSLITSILILFQGGLLYSQDTISLNSIIQKNQKLIEEIPTEKVYLHFDKPYYALGDTIWFKGYVATGQDLPSDLSKVLYVDIISDKDSLIRSLRLPVVNTSAYGSLTLDPSVYRTGTYRVVAYTYWMLNFSDDYFFSKNIPVGNAIDKKIITNITLKGQNTGTLPTITAQILYKDPDGKPLANKRINWKVISLYETIARGRGTTDAAGRALLTLTANQKAALDTGILETILEAEDDKQITSTFPLKNSFSEADIQFFPEGGELIENIKGKVAFKAIQEKGLGLSVKGDITDNSGKVITTFESQHLGMGTFILMPETGKSYKANLTFSNGIKKTVTLPEIKPSGIVLSVINNSADNLALQITSNPAYYSVNKNKNYYIIARSKGVICFAAQAKLSSQLIAASIPKNKFPDGIVQLTLFSSAGEPLTERLAFIKHRDILALSLNTDKKVYSSRQAVKMNVNAKSKDIPVQGNFSVSVISESKVPFDEDEETTILSSFLLSSELKGYIEKPNYYFNKITEKKLADLDVLMLTQGYRKFEYKEILAGKTPVITVLPERGIEFTGTLRSSNGMPVSRGSLKLVVPKNRFYAETTTNVRGEFKFENVNVPDSAEVTISARSSADTGNMMIMLNGSTFPMVSKNVNMPGEEINIDSILNPYLENSKKQYRMSTQTLKEVVVRAAPIKSSHADYPALSGLSPVPDHLIQSDRFKGCTVLLNCLQPLSMGLVYADNNLFVSKAYNSGMRVPIQIFYNGMPVDVSYLNSIIPSEIDNIEVFLKDDMGMVNRTYNSNGIMVINAKKTAKTPINLEDLKKLFPPKNVLTFNPLGYLKSREFYSPKYTTEASRTVGIDLRTTIYWNPKVFTDKDGNMSFTFYNGDNKGTYKTIVEGTDIEGNLARYIYRYKVE